MNREEQDIHALRQNYTRDALDVADMESHPIAMFQKWFDEARDSQIMEPNAMIISTVSADLRVHARTVLLKEITERGFIFYTNYNSAKAIEIEHNHAVALTFLWKELERQVRIEGVTTKIDEAKSAAYFSSRPRGSQLGAWASPQSEVIDSRSTLEANLATLQDRFPEGTQIPKPPHWGGYEVIPDYVEFWQGRESRLHDRIAYSSTGSNWDILRLAP